MSKSFSPELTYDDFLGGRIVLAQPKDGYRAGSDAVVLAACVPSLKSGAKVLDVGCGSGVVGLCVGARFPDIDLTGVEVQQQLCSLAQENARNNHIKAHFVLGDIGQGTTLKGQSFDVVVSNPPFYNEPTARQNAQCAVACQEKVPLRQWIGFCTRHVAPKGFFVMIHRPQHLGDILSFLPPSFGAVDVIALFSRADKPASRIIVRACLGSRRGLQILPPIVLNTPAGVLTPQAQALMRVGHGYEA